MPRPLTIPACATIVFATLISTCFARNWTDRKGRQVEADLVSLNNGIVTLKRGSDGNVFDLPLELLSDQDQAFVKTSAAPDDALAQLKNAGAKNVTVDEKTGAVSIHFFPKGAITQEHFEQLRSVEKLES